MFIYCFNKSPESNKQIGNEFKMEGSSILWCVELVIPQTKSPVKTCIRNAKMSLNGGRNGIFDF